jgi:hypothetical protein
MNRTNGLLAVLVSAMVVVSSLALVEYSQIDTLDSRLRSQTATTVTQTTTAAMLPTIGTTTTVTNVTTIICPSGMTCAPFTYGPASQIRVDSVEANETEYNGVVFWVTVENAGSSPIGFTNYWFNFSVPTTTSS